MSGQASPRFWLLIAAVAIVGAIERLLWAMREGIAKSHAGGELPEVARSFAKHLTLNDAYKPGQGPTAHVMPIPAIFAGLIYRVFGITTVTSELILLACAIGLAFLSFGLGYLVMREIGISRGARLAGLLILFLVPLNFRLEAQSFRIWEGSLASACALGFLVLLIKLDKVERTDLRATIMLALIAALTMFISPPLGVSAYVCTMIYMVKCQPARLWIRSIVVATVALVLVLAPWTIRNALVMGHAIPLRSNFGLEVAVGMNPGAVNPADPAAQFHARLSAIHPFSGTAGYAGMRAAGGEVAYAQLLQKETFAWMGANPTDALGLAIHHARQYFFPSPWMWELTWKGPFTKGGPQMLLTWVFTALGLIGAVVAASRDRRALYAAIMLYLPVLTYMLTQPTMRYRYIGYALTIYFATDLLFRIVRWLRDASSAAWKPGVDEA